jgi:rubrerythrin
MRPMTQENIKAAFAGESQAHLKYLNFADKAAKEDKPNVARLFQAAAFSEQIHAGAHLRVMQGVGATVDNLAGAIGGESFEVDEMYPAYIAVAKDQDDQAAMTSFKRAYEAEKVHKQLYGRAKTAVEAGADVQLQDVFVCGHCGFTIEGARPDKCPMCGHPGEQFKQF